MKVCIFSIYLAVAFVALAGATHFTEFENKCQQNYTIFIREAFRLVDINAVVPEDQPLYNSFKDCVYKEAGLIKDNGDVDVENSKAVITDIFEKKHKDNPKLKEDPLYVKNAVATSVENCKDKKGAVPYRNCFLRDKTLRELFYNIA